MAVYFGSIQSLKKAESVVPKVVIIRDFLAGNSNRKGNAY